MIACRDARLADASHIDELALAAGLSVDARRSLALPHASVYTARVDGQGKLAGFAIAWRVGDELEIIDLATHAELRRRGVASALLRNLIERSRELGLGALLLEVRSQNSAALALYRKHGFQVVLERRNYYRDPPDAALCLRLTLAPRSSEGSA